jgi:GT2 family glycosyltransferase
VTAELPVTVIVCTRNRAHYLLTCLESLAHQNCDVPFEILVVDNASTDNTPELLHEWCLKDTRFRMTREPKVGLSAAKNTGVRLARGRLLLFTDDDVILDSNWVRAYLDFFERRGQDSIIAGGPIFPIVDDLGSWPAWFDSCALRDVGLLDYGEERPLAPTEYAWGANMAIPASRFGRFGWNERVGRRGDERGTFEDTDYQDQLRLTGGTTWFCPSAKIHHRILRSHLAPSQVLGTAFRRGRNQFWKEIIQQRAAGQPGVRDDYIRGLSRLVGNLATLVFWSLTLKVCRMRGVFVRAHRAAWRSGWWMDVLRVGRETSALSVALGRATLFVVDAVVNGSGQR